MRSFGSVLQNSTHYTSHSYFKTDIRKEQIPNIPSHQPVITYKGIKTPDDWTIDPNLHFFNALETNIYAGQSMSIVDTPILP